MSKTVLEKNPRKVPNILLFLDKNMHI